MIWDKAVRLAELLLKDIPEGSEREGRAKSVHQAMNAAKLFVIDAAPHEFLQKEYTQEQCDFFRDNFFLPFRTTAIEDKASLIILFDTYKHQRGLDTERQWIEFLPWNQPLEYFREDEDDAKDLATELNDDPAFNNTCLLTCGTIHKVVFNPGEKSFIDGRIDGAAVYNTDTGHCVIKGSDFSQMPEQVQQRLVTAGIRNALQAIDEVAYFNDPSHFVLEETPPSFERRMQRKQSKKAKLKIPRAGDRPIYTVLKAKQIRRRMHLPDPWMPGGNIRRPHERRAHLRTYSDDAKRWPNKHGQTVVVRGSWIGPSESVVNGKRYRVLVDMRPPQLPEGVTSGKEG